MEVQRIARSEMLDWYPQIFKDNEQTRSVDLVLSKHTHHRHASVVKQLMDYATLSVGLDFIRFANSLAATLG